MRTWTRCGGALALVTAIALGACGDSGDSGDDGPSAGATMPPAGDDHGDHGDHGDHHHGTGSKAAFTAAEADATVEVTMTDFAFAGIPAAVGGRKVLFEVANRGPSEHELVVFPKGGDDALGGVGPLAGDRSGTLAVALEPGAYTAKCLVKAGDRTHADLGMQTDFTVG